MPWVNCFGPHAKTTHDCRGYRGNTLYASNAGDSRTVSSVGGRALCLTTDHKPGDERERKRIEDAGGFVEFNRVNGNLALSRALGDFAFKVQGNALSNLITTLV